MISKVLIVDDHDIINEGVLAVLERKGITNVEKANYCDQAFLKLQRAELEGMPFDLLITDLSFQDDHLNVRLASGDQLVEAVREAGLSLPVIVYSMETRLQRVRTLVQQFNINGYVCKGRRSSFELDQAIEAVLQNKLFLSEPVQQAVHSQSCTDIQEYDILLIKQLSLGLSQSEISTYLETQNITPRSLSSIEKRLNKLKDEFKANNAIHLVSIVKDLGLI
ncbi:response regulator [Formosa sp. S-31]|uniref:response regulator n=1 Tax=Formosa sp. S-31 TaxID=2790949 RepID=UPI003EBCD8AC